MATKHGQFLVFGGGAPAESYPNTTTTDIIDRAGYTMKLKKTWIDGQWQIVITRHLTDCGELNRWELYLSPEELQAFKQGLL
jgi:hypothetical protein